MKKIKVIFRMTGILNYTLTKENIQQLSMWEAIVLVLIITCEFRDFTT